MALPLRWRNVSVQVKLLFSPASRSLPEKAPLARDARATEVVFRCDFKVYPSDLALATAAGAATAITQAVETAPTKQGRPEPPLIISLTRPTYFVSLKKAMIEDPSANCTLVR
jgi:hypothetical protein